MIRVTRTPPAAMLERHARVAAAMAEIERERPEVVNAGPAREIWMPRPLYYRGRRISPRPISWEDGLALLEAASALERWAKRPDGDLDELRRLYREIVDLCWIVIRPRWMPRWLQRLRRNPFRRATETEIREVLAFLGRCRTISLVGSRP